MSKAENYEMALGDHLEELRWRLLRILIFVVVSFLIAFLFFTSQLLELVLYPIKNYSVILGRKPDIGLIITLKVLDRFLITLFVSLIASLVISIPYSLFEFWLFLRPALMPREKKLLARFFPFVILLFIAGVAFGYFIVIPVSTDFLVNFGESSLDPVGIQSNITLGSYLNYFFIMTVMLGLIFEVPVIMMFTVKFTDVEPGFFAKYRRHFIVLAFILSMFVTPPDVFTQIMLAIPMVLLYEFGIFLTKIVQKTKAKTTSNDYDSENLQKEKNPDVIATAKNEVSQQQNSQVQVMNPEIDNILPNNYGDESYQKDLTTLQADDFENQSTSPAESSSNQSTAHNLDDKFLALEKSDIKSSDTNFDLEKDITQQRKLIVNKILSNKNIKTLSEAEIEDIIIIIEEFERFK